MFSFDHHETDRAGRIMDATGGRGVDVVLEMLATKAAGKLVLLTGEK